VEVKVHAFLTLALDEGELSASFHAGRNPVPTGQKAGWDPELVWMQWHREEIPSLLMLGIKPLLTST